MPNLKLGKDEDKALRLMAKEDRCPMVSVVGRLIRQEFRVRKEQRLRDVTISNVLGGTEVAG